MEQKMLAMEYDPPAKDLVKIVKKKGEKHMYNEENKLCYWVWRIEDLVLVLLENPLKDCNVTGKFAFALENLDIDGEEGDQ